MTRPKEFISNRQIRFTETIYLGIESYILSVKIKTGARINFSEAVRSLVEIALKHQGIDIEMKE